MRTLATISTMLAVAAATSRVFVLSAVAVLAMACVAHDGRGSGQPIAPPSTSRASHGAVYHFIPTGGDAAATRMVQPRGAIAGMGFAGDRFLVFPDGRMTTAPGRQTNLGGVAVPARLGGGYLFWSNILYRAPSFLGPLEPVAVLETNVINVAFGHDSMLLYGPNQARRAFALDPPRPVPLSPHGVVQIGGTDDERVLAIDAVGRALASVDGGKTWKDVSVDLGGQPQGVLGLPANVAFVTDNEGAWLELDGSIERRPLPEIYQSRGARSRQAEVKDNDLKRLLRAVLFGYPRPDGRVDLPEGPDVMAVDLVTGEAASPRRIGPDGSSCMLLTPEGDGLAFCAKYSGHAKNTVDVVAHALGAAPLVEKTFVLHPQAFFHGGSLVVVAPCESTLGGSNPIAAATSEVICIRHPAGTWEQLDSSAALGTKWKVLFWLPAEGSGAAAIVLEQGVRGREPANGLLDVGGGRVTPFDTAIPGLSESVASKWVVRRDGSIHGFTSTGTVAIDANGHVTRGARVFAAVASAGGRALAREPNGTLWQTTDAGESWVEVAPPSVDVSPVPQQQSPYRGMRCGDAGCALPHPSGIGAWLRVGWPIDPPSEHAGASPAEPPDAGLGAGASAPSLVSPRRNPPPRLPKLVCVAKAELKARSERSTTGVNGTDADVVGMLGGRTLPRGSPDHEFVSRTYRDRFDGPIGGLEAIEHALRAALRFDTGPVVDGHWKVNPATRVEGYYVETFDPAGRIHHAFGSLGGSPEPTRNATLATQPAATNQELEAHPSRPVLAAAHPGEAAGVLLPAGDRTLWVTPSGTVRSTAACSGELEAFGGMVDAHGKLWIACEDYSRAVDVIDGETGQTRLRLPSILPWVWQPEAEPDLYGGGTATFLPNPDAIAVGPDDKLAVVRLPSLEPASVDDPAWLLTPDGPPVELAPWSTLEPATSLTCSRTSAAFRVLVQTAEPWVTLDGANGFYRQPGMTAVVRWARDRVCLEAIELGYREIEDPQDSTYGVQVMAVARFAGTGVGGGLVGVSRSAKYRAPANCVLQPPSG